MNSHVPEIQINGSLKSVFRVSFLTTANFDALLVDAIHQAGHCAQSVILAIQEIGDGAQARFRFAVRLHDAVYFSQQFGVLVFCFWLDSGGDVVDASYAGLIFMNAHFYDPPIPAKHILGNTLLALE